MFIINAKEKDKTHCDDGNTLSERERDREGDDITRKGNNKLLQQIIPRKSKMKLSQQIITRKGYLVHYDTKVSNL